MKTISTTVYDYAGFFELVYGQGGLPKDKTLFKRIRYFSYDDFSYTQETEVKPYFIVLSENKKVIGICKIGYYSSSSPMHVYSFNSTSEKEYSIAYFSIDIEHRGKGYTSLMAETLFRFLKEKNLDLRTSTYTVVGKAKLKPVLNRFAKQYGVNFVDRPNEENTFDHIDEYDSNLNRKDEILTEEKTISPFFKKLISISKTDK